MKTYIYPITIIISLLSVQLQAQTVMTLEQCRAQAVAYNKELQNASLQQDEAKAYQKAARTAYLPKVEASADVMHIMGLDDLSMDGGFLPTAASPEAGAAGQFNGISNVYSPGMTVELGDISIVSAGLSVMQPIYAGGKIITANKQAHTGVEMAGYGYELKHSQVIEKTDHAFWQIAVVEANIGLAQEYIEMLTELEQKMTDMYEVGLVPASEKLKVSVKKNEAQLNLMRADNGLKVAKMHLNQVIGQDLNTPVEISFADDAVIALLEMANGLDNALANRSEIKLMQNQVQMSAYDKKIQMAEYLPTVGVGVQYTGSYVSEFKEDFTFTPMVAAQVSIPLFAWGQGKHKRQAAELKIRQAETNLSNTNDLINLEVLSVQVQVEEAYEAVLIAEKNLKEAKESLDETQASFDVGLNTTTELLNAQADWQQASTQLVQAKAQFRILETTWKRVVGAESLRGL